MKENTPQSSKPARSCRKISSAFSICGSSIHINHEDRSRQRTRGSRGPARQARPGGAGEPRIWKTTWSIVGCDSIADAFGNDARRWNRQGAGQGVEVRGEEEEELRQGWKGEEELSARRKAFEQASQGSEGQTHSANLSASFNAGAGDAASSFANWLKNLEEDLEDLHRCNRQLPPRREEKGSPHRRRWRVMPRNAWVSVEEAGSSRSSNDPGRDHLFQDQKRAVVSSFPGSYLHPPESEIPHVRQPHLRVDSCPHAAYRSRSRIFERTVTSTIAEAAQDTVNAIPFVAESGC